MSAVATKPAPAAEPAVSQTVNCLNRNCRHMDKRFCVPHYCERCHAEAVYGTDREGWLCMGCQLEVWAA